MVGSGEDKSLLIFFFNDTATTEIYTLSLHDALPISPYYTYIHHTSHAILHIHTPPSHTILHIHTPPSHTTLHICNHTSHAILHIHTPPSYTTLHIYILPSHTSEYIHTPHQLNLQTVNKTNYLSADFKHLFKKIGGTLLQRSRRYVCVLDGYQYQRYEVNFR